MSVVAFSPYTMSFQAETTIYQNEVKCRISENDFNYSQNPSIIKIVTVNADLTSSSVYYIAGVERTIKTTFTLSPVPYDITINYTVDFTTGFTQTPHTVTAEFILPAGQSTFDHLIYYTFPPYNIGGTVNTITNTTINSATYQTYASPRGTVKDFVTGSDFRPYATTVGLFNAMNELLVVGKLATPYPIPSNTDMTFIIRWDS